MLSFYVCLPVNALNAELDCVRKDLNEKADEINRICHEREKHRNYLENIVHEINSKYCVVCEVWHSRTLLSAARTMSLDNIVWLCLVQPGLCFYYYGGGGGKVARLWDGCSCYKDCTYNSMRPCHSSSWLPSAVARFASAQHVGFVLDKAALKQVFSEYFGFPCQSFHQFLRRHNRLGLAQ
jgi:hypothetical protein